MRYKLDSVIKLVIYLGLFFGMGITLWGVFGGIGVLLAFPAFILTYWKRDSLAAVNAMLILALPGIGSWIGASLAFTPSLILLVGLAVYDLIAVFGTKHMVTLAEGAKGKLPLMFGIPVGERILSLGTGDLAIPLVFTVSVLRDHTMMHAAVTGLGGLAGLIALFFISSTRKTLFSQPSRR